MQYVRVEPTDVGYLMDPTAYLEELPRLAGLLPVGAQTFATDPQHYDFNSQRFIKNLKPERLTYGDTDEIAWLELHLRHNCWRHEEDLIIRYHGVQSVTVDPPRSEPDVTDLREVFLDEILPHEAGCSHEISCLGGSIVVTCADLEAAWVYADCPERQPNS
ncbi:hypothetical protein Rhe02_38840 [Rhizocola hellebori]|uniref:Uncharacterized protein n=1 Tax=Rhizocola hellebori TaxID=1392758 RepID=A0A8J3VH33_9ACTN|nr:hypothetical protein [Rhizocola hellebori]GIH05817.1 hypothetical protein Rhe02_38840 [Rhizocola hellebori]